MGLVINKPSSLVLTDIFESLDISTNNPKHRQQRVLIGGPVKKQQGFVIHRPKGQWEISIKLYSQNTITSSQDILECMAKGDGPKKAIVLTGYCSWEPNQLETEISQNDWLCAPVTGTKSEIIYDIPYRLRWQKALEKIGIKNRHQLTTTAGHA